MSVSPSIGPVDEVMGVEVAAAVTAGEPAATIPDLEGETQPRGHDAAAPAEVQGIAVGAEDHGPDHPVTGTGGGRPTGPARHRWPVSHLPPALADASPPARHRRGGVLGEQVGVDEHGHLRARGPLAVPVEVTQEAPGGMHQRIGALGGQ